MDEPRFFHLTGRRAGATLAPIADRGLRPALFARFGDLTRLRYDFPLVLTDGDPSVVSLSGLFDGILDAIASGGLERDRARRLLRRVEREIRALLAGGSDGTVDALWDEAVARLVTKDGEQVRRDLLPLRAALRIAGQIVDCDAELPARLVTHLWHAVEARRAEAMRRDIDGLVARLSQLVRADFLRSEAGRSAPALRAGIGARHQELFDFDAMARLLAKPSGPIGLPESRRRRIASTLTVLQAQPFFGDRARSFSFRRVDVALAAFRERLPLMADLVRAISVAELELAGAYVEATHDPYFADFDQTALAREDVARFPSYLVRADADDGDGTTRALLMEALTGRAPMKILLETDDVFGLGGRLATTALGLGDVFVLQSASAGLYGQALRVRAALEYAGPALLSVFPGVLDRGRLPPYLVAAAATESRAFPTFTYDPSAAPDLAHRLSLDGDPQPERPWPVHPFTYADDELQQVGERLAFTPVDFALCDPALASSFAEVPRAGWTAELVPAADRLDGAADRTDTVPFVWAIDAEDRLRRLVVDERLLRLARRTADAWARLSEITEPASVVAATQVPDAPAVPAPAEDRPAAAEAPASEAHGSDDPYIETPRCTTCNECTTLNGRMFAYNENRQAYIADQSAGTYSELVEAAEGCQVAIIHPGKPRDPNEPGLDELMARAEPFR
ncbi:MAG TPA: hypothetical protein DCK98_07390 [Chloroflexi bacterium]|jgi:hypothetical protein|nr:hypothetical protein [Chloroflexota bacterium]HAL25170.1 hypothetical protein [Chloroflexota bacterium]